MVSTQKNRMIAAFLKFQVKCYHQTSSIKAKKKCIYKKIVLDLQHYWLTI